MPIADTIASLGCVSPCDTLSELDDSQFFAVLIDQLAGTTGVSLSDITAMDLMEATQAAWCEVGDRVVGDVSPMALKATALHLMGATIERGREVILFALKSGEGFVTKSGKAFRLKRRR